MSFTDNPMLCVWGTYFFMNTRIKTIYSGEQKYRVVFKKVRGAKNMRITLSGGGGVTVTGPYYIPFVALEQFLQTKKSWVVAELKKLSQVTQKSIPLTPVEFVEAKEGARLLVMEKLTYWGKRYNVSWKKVTIRNQKTRFGSCSAKGNLSFQAAIVFLPERLQDYLVVHELCHLKEMNHSKHFWSLVEESFTDAKERSRELSLWSRR
jgi:predicted metal-dependent hydrolase